MKLFKSIQDNIRLKSPNLWNLYLIPIVGCTLLLHILLFCVTYAVVQIPRFKIGYTEESYTAFTRTTEGQIIITCSIILAIILAVWWFINLSKNNPIKSFYPLSKKKYYLNFIGATFILSLLSFSPIIVEYARYLKMNNINTFIDNKKDQETIIKFDVLTNFMNPYSIEQYIDNNEETLSENLNNESRKKPLASYLFYNPNNDNYLGAYAKSFKKLTKEEIRQLKVETKKEILNRNKNYLLNIYNDFNAYHKRITNSTENIVLNPEELSQQIVNDPNLLLRPISDIAIIRSHSKLESPQISYSNYQGEALSNLANYIQRLTYERKMHYNAGEHFFALFVALFFSILITLLRLTNVKTILLSCLYLALLNIANSIIKNIVPVEIASILIMICGTIVIPSIFIRKAFKQNGKNKLSDIIMIILIVSLLLAPIMFGITFYFHLDEIYTYFYMLLAMLPIHYLMLNWKALPNK